MTTQTVGMFSSSGWSGRGSLAALVKELERQLESKVDFVTPASSLAIDFSPDGTPVLLPVSATLRNFIGAGMPMSRHAFVQLIGRLVPGGVPADFADRLIKGIKDKPGTHRPGICEQLINSLLKETPNKFLVRCLDNQVRAVLSNSYRCIDHYDIATEALRVAREHGAEVLDASLTPSSMRIRFVNKKLWEVVEVTRSDTTGSWYAGGLGAQTELSKVAARSWGELPGGPGTVYPTICLGNSETGGGKTGADFGLLAGICFNLALVQQVLAQIHLGSTIPDGILTREAIEADNKAIMLKVRDTIGAAYDPERFPQVIAHLKDAAAQTLDNPTTAINNLVSNTDLTETERDSILAHFIRDYTPTRAGVSAAVSRYAQDADPDRCMALEDLSGQLLTTPSLLTA